VAVATAARQKLRDDGGDADDTENAVRRVKKPIFIHIAHSLMCQIMLKQQKTYLPVSNRVDY
jgi:hypothetical protein